MGLVKPVGESSHLPRPIKIAHLIWMMISLSPHELRVVAAQACCHPSTVKRYLTNQPIRSTCRDRIVRALSAAGLEQKAAIQPGGAP